jgi:hypothetical protein
MTFVLCKIIKSRVFIFADTRVTEHAVSLPPEQGLIKTSFLSPQVAISFSQSPDLAARDIKLLGEQYKGCFGYSDALNFFSKSSSDTNNDYILVFLNPLRILKISSGVANRTLSGELWIGDQAARTRYLEYANKKRKGADIWKMHTWSHIDNSQDSEKFSRIFAPFQSTLEDPEIISAGNFYTVATNVGAEFKFMAFATIYFDNFGPNPMTPTSGENFEYRFSVLAPMQSGVNACAFDYPTRREGICFTAIFLTEWPIAAPL